MTAATQFTDKAAQAIAESQGMPWHGCWLKAELRSVKRGQAYREYETAQKSHLKDKMAKARERTRHK